MPLPQWWASGYEIETTTFNGGAYAHPFGKKERGRIEIYRHADDGHVEIRVGDIQGMSVPHMEKYLVAVLKAVEIGREFQAQSEAERKKMRGDGGDK